MSEQQSAASPTEPSSSVSSTDRAYITNTSWDISASHIQAPVITDSRYHMTHVTGSPSWGGSAHLPSLVSGDSYNPRVSINPESYTRSSIETGESFGSTFQLEGYKRVDLPHRLDYRVSGLMPSSSRPQLASEEYTRTSSNQECYRNYATAYDETRSSVSHSTQYRVVPGPSAYSRSNTEESYPRQQVESGFYLRNDPGHKTLVQADLPTDTGYNKGLTHERYSTSNAEPEDYSKGKHGAETHLDPGLESDTNSASDQSNNSLRRYDGEPIDVTASEGRDTEDTAHTKSTCSVSTTAVSDNQNATHTQSESTDKHGSKMILYPESSGTTQSGFCAVESISETDTETVRDKAISAESKTNHRFTYGANASVQSGPISASTHEIRHSVQGPNRTVPHSLMVESTPSSSPQTNADKDLCKDMRENLGTSFESNRGCLTGDTFNKAAEEEGCIPADATETLSPHSDQSTKESFKLSISQIQEIHQFKTNHPEAKCKEIAEHFSENWGLNVPSEIIRDVLNMNKQEGIQILEKEIRAEELSHEMKKAIMSYKEHCASTSLVDIAKHFSKKWNAVLRDDVIINILNEFLKPTGVVTNEEKKADEMNNAEEEKQDISSEKKSEILQYKERNQKMTTEEIAAHFSKKWQTEITKDEIVDILNDHKDALSIASSISAEHSNTTSSLHLPRKKTVLMSDDHRLVDTSGQSYYNDDVTRFVPVTPGEAREGLMKAIAYFMANPSIANGYVQTLWSIVKYIDSHDENGNVSEKEPSSDSEGFSHEEFVKIKQEVSEAESSFVSDTTTAEEIKLDNIPTSDPVRHLRKPMQQKPFKATSRYNRHSTTQKNCSTRKRVSNVQNHVEGDKDQHNSDNKADDVRIDISQKLHCPECDQCFTEFTLLLDHITRHSEEKLLMAHVCSQEDTTIVRPKTSGRNRGHPRFLAGESTLQSIKSENDTDISPKRKRRIKLQNCTLCGRQFNDYSNFRRHMRLHAGLKPHKCPTCGVSFIESNALKKHMRTHTGEKPFLCTTCGKRVTTLAGLQSHARLHTGEKPFKCSVCGKDFAQSSSLKRHMVIHTGERPYSCPQCGKSFPRSEDLKMHIRTHTGQKPYKCLVCGKCFIKSSYLQKHARIHTGEKPYKCSTCGEAFAQSDILAKHIRVHTGERPYCCTVCGKTFTQSGSLYHHMKMHKQQQQTSVDQQKQKATLGLPEHADSDITPLSESVKMQHNNDAKLSALSQPLSDSDTAPQVRVFSDIPRHYLSQWRPY